MILFQLLGRTKPAADICNGSETALKGPSARRFFDFLTRDIAALAERSLVFQAGEKCVAMVGTTLFGKMRESEMERFPDGVRHKGTIERLDRIRKCGLR